jgi:hypothetical protein
MNWRRPFRPTVQNDPVSPAEDVEPVPPVSISPHIIITQTSDADRYYRMLQATARTTREFCRRHGHGYESYVGIKRGVHGWQAAFNRLFQMQELIARNHRGWVIHMDADAYIHDLDFDLATYLAAKSDRAGVLSTIPGSDHPWALNSGVMMVNLGHAEGRRMVGLWMDAFMAFDNDWLVRSDRMMDYDNDQEMLYKILCREPAIREAMAYEGADFMNVSDSRFIRQYLTAYTTDLAERIAIIERLTDEVLGIEPRPSVEGEAVVTGLYRAILNREPDAPGLAPYAAVIDGEGAARGTQFVADALLNSAEYRTSVAH